MCLIQNYFLYYLKVYDWSVITPQRHVCAKSYVWKLDLVLNKILVMGIKIDNFKNKTHINSFFLVKCWYDHIWRRQNKSFLYLVIIHFLLTPGHVHRLKNLIKIKKYNISNKFSISIKWLTSFYGTVFSASHYKCANTHAYLHDENLAIVRETLSNSTCKWAIIP